MYIVLWVGGLGFRAEGVARAVAFRVCSGLASSGALIPLQERRKPPGRTIRPNNPPYQNPVDYKQEEL